MNKKLLIALLGCILSFGSKAQVPTLVHDISPSVGSSYPKAITVHNNALYFAAVQPSGPYYNLWKYDGTITTLATTIGTSGSITLDRPMASANGRLYFCATKSQFNSDNYVCYYPGTGSAIVLDTTYTVTGGNTNMLAINNKVYFFGEHTGVKGIYSVDATTNAFQLAVDASAHIINTATSTTMFFVSEMVYYNSKIYFVGQDYEVPTPNAEMFVYDPANGNTVQLPSQCATNCDHQSAPMNLHVGANNKLYFSARSFMEGRELYEINGNNPATQLTALNLNSDGIGGGEWGLLGNLEMKTIFQYGNNVYFGGTISGPVGYEIMKYDLTNNSTTLVKDNMLSDDGGAAGFVLFNNKVHFFAGTDVTSAVEIMKTDGTSAGTTPITNTNTTGITVGSYGGVPNFPVEWNNNLYFVAEHATTGHELYRLAGTASVASVSKTNNIKVYPVPAREEAILELDLETQASLSVTLTDVTGKKVYNSGIEKYNSGIATIKVPVQQLAQGVYQYTISSDKGEVIGNGRIAH